MGAELILREEREAIAPDEALTPLTPGFDYSVMDAAVADEMRDAAARVRRRMVAASRDVGRDLIVIKDRVEHGQFVAWVENECRLNIRTAQRLMQAAGLVSKCDKLSYLPQATLELLTAGATPEPTKQAIIDRVNAGERPSPQDIARDVQRDGAVQTSWSSN